MCGITGFRTQKDFKLLNEDLIAAATRLRHRGPDDAGTYTDEYAGIGLAHRRLSIIDLSSAGRQPMRSDDGKAYIVYNGEVYNFDQIKKVLIGKGHVFHTRTDTEVILKSYLEWGIGCLKQFVGMFSLAIWDPRKNLLFLARDRMGIKPLYYYHKDGNFLFASELKALMAFKNFPKNVDSEAISLFLHYQYVPAPRTIFDHTYKLLPGHFLAFDGQDLKIQAYWKIPDLPGIQAETLHNEDQALDRLDEILTRSISDRLISDVPLGALLSGGIDSSTVVALMQKVNSSPVRTFSIGFKEEEYNEAAWAAKVARHLRTDHTEMYVSPRDALNAIPGLPEIYDEPFADSSAIPTCLVSKLARSRVTVALSGDGGDEQFCGYVRYWTTRAMAGGFKRLPPKLKRLLAAFLKRLPTDLMEKCYLPLRPHLPQQFRVANFSDKWRKLIQQTSRTNILDLYRLTICLWSAEEIAKLSGKDLPAGQFESSFEQTRLWPLLSRLMRVDQETYLPDAMLTKVDRASMASSLEVRVPLLDHRVVEFTAKLSETMKYRNGAGKYLLKKLLSRYVPKALFERPKMGFGVPIDRWLRKDLKGLLLDYLSPASLKKEGLFDIDFVQARIHEHMSGQANHQYRLWSLLMWEMWRRHWLSS